MKGMTIRKWSIAWWLIKSIKVSVTFVLMTAIVWGVIILAIDSYAKMMGLPVLSKELIELYGGK